MRVSWLAGVVSDGSSATVNRNHPPRAADFVEVAVPQEDEQPCAQIGTGLPRVDLCDRPRETFLYEVISVVELASNVPGVPPQMRDLRLDQLQRFTHASRPAGDRRRIQPDL
jgi:hypothetical protein